MKNAHMKLVSTLIGIATVLACGGGGGSTQGGGGGGTISEGQRLATIQAGQAEYTRLGAQPKATRDPALVTFYKSQASVEDAGISSTNSVWVRFKDGTLHYIFDNKPGPRPGAPSGRRTLAKDMPANPTAYSDISLDPGWTDITSQIGGWLTNCGYTVNGNLRVSDFEAMNNVGIIFWQTHSAEGNLKGGGKDFAFMTSTVASEALGSGIYKSLRDNGYLSTGDVVLSDNPFRYETRYAITNKYIRDRLRGKLSRNSLVAIDSCTGANTASAAAWKDAGAACFVGWDALSGRQSEIAFQRLFDRLTAANEIQPFAVPEQRPFEMSRIVQWMQQNGYDQDPSPASVAQMKFFFNAANGDFEIIRPTITRVLYEANNQAEPFFKWLIEGTFGADPGPANRRVVYGTTQLEVVRWEDYGIVVKIPKTNIPSGDIQVIIGTRKSQPVPMTEWTVPFTYTLIGEETLKYVVKITAKLRADVRGQRFVPGTDPTYSPIVVWTLEDTTGNVTASGSLHDNQGKLIERWTGGSTLKPLTPTGPTLDYAHFQGNFDRASSKLMNFLIVSTGRFDTLSGANRGSGGINGITIPMSITVNWPTLRINGNTINANPGQLGAYGVSATLQWPNVTPTNAPVEQDQRRPIPPNRG